jgi:hypothetical protein
MSGKISWPSHVDNPNFPQWMIHESVQDQDFQLLRRGDALFVQLDGTILHYDGAYGDEIYLIFINEGGYYYPSSGTGISVALLTQYDLQTGLFDTDPAPDRHTVTTGAGTGTGTGTSASTTVNNMGSKEDHQEL